MTVRQLLPGIPTIKLSGDIGAFVEPDVHMQSGGEYFVAISDGTLLRGEIDGPLTIQHQGSASIAIEDGVATVTGDLQWAVVTGCERLMTVEETREFREQRAEWDRGEHEPEPQILFAPDEAINP